MASEIYIPKFHVHTTSEVMAFRYDGINPESRLPQDNRLSETSISVGLEKLEAQLHTEHETAITFLNAGKIVISPGYSSDTPLKATIHAFGDERRRLSRYLFMELTPDTKASRWINPVMDTVKSDQEQSNRFMRRRLILRAVIDPEIPSPIISKRLFSWKPLPHLATA